ncbi:MAG: hypothetical protein IPK13_05885 [Deltaproteobacteria bacterium]|nr:hypothetical protein [Deltaproteobacteria bacterium]
MTKKPSSRSTTEVDSKSTSPLGADAEASPTEPRVAVFDPRTLEGEFGPSADVESKTEPLVEAVRPARVFEDDRPTELYAPTKLPQLQETREQCLVGTAIQDILAQSEHRLKAPLERLVERARRDLPGATLDVRSSLMLRHQFEFNRRVGYQLRLTMFDVASERSIEVSDEVDHDGRALRRGSLISRLLGL